jgi:CheY-like chemotaxis protein
MPRQRDVLYIEDNEVNQVLMEGMLAHRPAIGLRLAATARSRAGDGRGPAARPGAAGHPAARHRWASRCCKRLRQLPGHAHAGGGRQRQRHARGPGPARAAGFADYLTKPVTLEALLAAVATRLPGGND